MHAVTPKQKTYPAYDVRSSSRVAHDAYDNTYKTHRYMLLKMCTIETLLLMHMLETGASVNAQNNSFQSELSQLLDL